MVFNCVICNKEYKSKDSFKKHELFCQTLSRSKKERENELEEMDNLPNLRELFNLTKDLLIKYEKLEKENHNIKQIIYKRQKKINVIEWLNKNVYPLKEFKEWYLNLEFVTENLDLIFENGNIEGTCKILDKIISDKNEIPIKCFSEKENTFYIYEKNEEFVKKWRILTNEELISFLKSINKKISKLFVNWQEKNKEKLEDEKFAMDYIKKIQKILGKNESFESECNKIKNKLFKLLKCNTKNLIEYDFK